MFNDELILIKKNNTYDKAGDKQSHLVETTLLCEVRSTTRNEFYNYGDNELRPEYIATINSCEYQNEKKALFRGNEYNITRVYELDRDTTELTLSRRISR